MSWNIQIQVNRDSSHDRSFESAILEAEPANEYQGGYAVDEARDQAIAAKRAAVALIDSSKLGEGPLTVTLSGHANEGHVPNAKWANEMVTINITNTSARPAA